MLDLDDLDVAVAPLRLDQPRAVVGAEIHDRGWEDTGRSTVACAVAVAGTAPERECAREHEERPVHRAVPVAICGSACRTFTT